jgi:hypothetical protein
VPHSLGFDPARHQPDDPGATRTNLIGQLLDQDGEAWP